MIDISEDGFVSTQPLHFSVLGIEIVIDAALFPIGTEWWWQAGCMKVYGTAFAWRVTVLLWLCAMADLRGARAHVPWASEQASNLHNHLNR